MRRRARKADPQRSLAVAAARAAAATAAAAVASAAATVAASAAAQVTTGAGEVVRRQRVPSGGRRIGASREAPPVIQACIRRCPGCNHLTCLLYILVYCSQVGS